MTEDAVAALIVLVDYLLAMKYDEHCNGQDDYVDNLVIGLKHVRRILRRKDKPTW